MSDSLHDLGLWHAGPLCPPLSPRVCSNSCPLSQWCYLTSAAPFSFCLQSLPSIRLFSSESTLHIRWPKYWSFSISPYKEYSGFIPFRIDWFDLLVVQGSLRRLLQHHISKASVFRHSAFFMVQLSHLYMTMGKTIALTTNHGSPIIKPGPKLTFFEGLGTQRFLISYIYLSSILGFFTYRWCSIHIH